MEVEINTTRLQESGGLKKLQYGQRQPRRRHRYQIRMERLQRRVTNRNTQKGTVCVPGGKLMSAERDAAARECLRCTVADVRGGEEEQ